MISYVGNGQFDRIQNALGSTPTISLTALGQELRQTISRAE
jgi:hypothetical protein